MDSESVNVMVETAAFDGVIVAVLAYGAVLMLYIQLLRVLCTRPKRNGIFWVIVVYSAILFTIATLSIGGKIKYAEYTYVTSRFDGSADMNSPVGWLPSEIFKSHASSPMNMMSQICNSLLPWVGDLLMLYRVIVVWNYRWWLLLIPLPIYLAHFSMSIPLLISETKVNDTLWESRSMTHGIIYYALCVAFNITISGIIIVRLVTMRRKLEIAMGRLQASFYTSKFTILVESGGFFTLWAIVYIATRAQNHWSQEVFLQPYSHIMAITRLLIVLRMAEHRAWSRDTVTAANNGNLDWEVSSAHSISLDTRPALELKDTKSPGSSSASMRTLR